MEKEKEKKKDIKYISLRLDPVLYKKLKMHCVMVDMSMQDFIRVAIQKGLSKD